MIDGGTTVSKTITRSQEIVSSKGPTGSVEFRNAQIFVTFIHTNLTNNGDLTPTFSEEIGQELSHKSIADIYFRCRVKFTRNAIGTKSPDFMRLGLPAINTSDELGSFGTSATRVGRQMDGSNWSVSGHVFCKSTTVGMSRIRLEQKYSSKTDFETWKDNQDFGWKNISMSRPLFGIDSFWYKHDQQNNVTN